MIIDCIFATHFINKKIMSREMKIYHVYSKRSKEHKYFGSIKAIYDYYENIGISRYAMYRFDFKKNRVFENEEVIIRFDYLVRSRNVS